jgi:hypothetical protein
MYRQMLKAWVDGGAALAAPSAAAAAEASAKARQWLVEWQQHHEASASSSPSAPVPPPPRPGFGAAYRGVLAAEGPAVARRVLAWMEHLARSGKTRGRAIRRQRRGDTR